MFNIRKSIKAQVVASAMALVVAVFICFFGIICWNGLKSESRLKEFREQLIAKEKEKLRSFVDIAFKSIEGMNSEQAKDTLKRLRYGESGYFWINDTGAPYPRMIMHPIIPALDGTVMDDPKYNCAMGKKQNLFQAFVDTAKNNAEGYVDYLWPKPLKSGLTEDKPKISFVRFYKPFSWVIGTGVYIDDIDAMVEKERQVIRTDSIRFARQASVAVVILTLIMFFLAIRLTDRFISGPVIKMHNHLKAHGNDLETRIPVMTENEIGSLIEWVNEYRDKLSAMMKEISGTMAALNAAIGEISSSISAQAAIASEQSAAVAEITSTVEELSASSSQIAEHSKSVVEIATHTWEDTAKGASAVEAIINKMHEINIDSENSIREILELGKKSKEISKVMAIINNIADQTKLIAFNAALEASSAGEAGKRFGVVAVEIRRLADSVMESTGEIEGKINEIQEATSRLVMVSEKGSKGIKDGLDHSVNTAELLIGIVTAAQQTTDAAKQISLSTQQQKTASSQVVVALRDIVSGSSQTANAITQIDTISKGLLNRAETMLTIMSKFKA